MDPNSKDTKVDYTKSIPRVHSDYCYEAAPKRFKIAQENNELHPPVDDIELEEIMSKRFAFINVWRSFSEEPI